ncbi:GNAT family N-acetyltransferase [Janibacter limosus]|uniref:GNAT family N-acetyltransferase n=1 Tax=Janibacter limosus TaxID=53458 RepID=A0A4P6MQZ2_9MICO|nr:GNAT family N-acetyltransferase [Janibacter limosus]QBF46031.1 GNAT family N-acetyltransferase [Janibacter limosus]
MSILLRTPSAGELAAITEEVGEWHTDSTPFQLHPGDIGWFGWRGDEVTAAALRTWWRDGRLVAAGLLDGPGLLRLAVAPAAMTDPYVADAVASDIVHEDGRALPAGEADVEAPSGATLRDALVTRGWTSGDEWTHLRRDLSRPITVPTDLRIEAVDARNAHLRTDVHRAAFVSEAFTDERWRSVAATPAYRSARCLVGLVGLVGEVPAAAITVWSAGEGRPGIIEPMGVNPAQRGHGHGVAITLAGAAALREMGCSSARVGTPSTNTAAVATYVAAGFEAWATVDDLRRA